MENKAKNHSNERRATLSIPMCLRQLFWFLTQEGVWDTQHLLCGGSNLELSHFCFPFAIQLAEDVWKRRELPTMVLYNPKEERKYLWSGAQTTDQVLGLGCPLMVDKLTEVGEVRMKRWRGIEDSSLVSYIHLFPFLCSRHTDLLLVPKWVSSSPSVFVLCTCCSLCLECFNSCYLPS